MQKRVIQRLPQRIDEEPVGLFVEREGRRLARRADDAPGGGREALEVLRLPTRGAGGQLRHDPDREQQLHPEGEAVSGAGVDDVVAQQRELVGQQPEHAGMGVGGLEQARDRIAGPGGGIQRSRVLPQRAVGGDGIHPGDGEQLAAALVEHRPDVEERLQPRAEAAA